MDFNFLTETFGSQSNIARQLSQHTKEHYSKQRVNNWKRQGVPKILEYVLKDMGIVQSTNMQRKRKRK